MNDAGAAVVLMDEERARAAVRVDLQILGLVSLCIGGGQGIAMLLQRVEG